MRYVLSDHARTVIAEREIRTAWLEQVLERPDMVRDDEDDPELEHRLGVVHEHGDRVLRVIINKTVRPVRVVTTYFDRTMRNRL